MWYILFCAVCVCTYVGNHSYGKRIWKSGHGNEDISIYQRRLTCMSIAPGQGGIWWNIRTGFLTFETVFVISPTGCCSTYMAVL